MVIHLKQHHNFTLTFIKYAIFGIYQRQSVSFFDFRNMMQMLQPCWLVVSLDSQSRAATCCGCHECSEEKIRPCLLYSAPPYCLPQIIVGWISGDMDLSDERCQTNLECEDEKGRVRDKGHKRDSGH